MWTAFRQVDPRFPPLFHGAGAPAPIQPDGRWNEHGVSYAQYFSLNPAGAWAECARYYSVRTAPRAAEMTRNLWVARVAASNIADLSSFDAYEDCGIPPRTAVGRHIRSQQLGRWLRDEGYEGVLSPSAALAGAVNLTLFGERYEKVLVHEWDGARAAPRSGQVPVTLAAEKACVPAALVTETVFENQDHPGLLEWRRRR